MRTDRGIIKKQPPAGQGNPAVVKTEEDKMSNRGFSDYRFAHYKILLWILAFLITAASAVYQRRTGPTYPLRGKVSVAGQEVAYQLLRSYTVGEDAPIAVAVPDTAINGSVRYRRFRSHDEWTSIPMQREGEELAARLPEQPPAGKIMYFVTLEKAGNPISLSGDTPVVLRYKGSVPGGILLPHVLLMFFAMLLSTRTGLETFDADGKVRRLMFWTIGLFFVGGFILGPLMQKFAFGAYWTGIPFGTDLTDNKTLIAMLGWVWAWIMNWKGTPRRGWIVFAAILMLAVYMIPHSLLGSELDYTQISE
jgi:hypothetical protein